MPETFLNYLRKERRRLDHELEQALAHHEPDAAQVARLQQLRRIVDDQLANWSADLSRERLAA